MDTVRMEGSAWKLHNYFSVKSTCVNITSVGNKQLAVFTRTRSRPIHWWSAAECMRVDVCRWIMVKSQRKDNCSTVDIPLRMQTTFLASKCTRKLHELNWLAQLLFFMEFTFYSTHAKQTLAWTLPSMFANYICVYECIKWNSYLHKCNRDVPAKLTLFIIAFLQKFSVNVLWTYNVFNVNYVIIAVFLKLN